MLMFDSNAYDFLELNSIAHVHLWVCKKYVHYFVMILVVKFIKFLVHEILHQNKMIWNQFFSFYM